MKKAWISFFMRVTGMLALIMAFTLGNETVERIVLVLFMALTFVFSEMAAYELSIMRLNILAIIRQIAELIRETRREVKDVSHDDDASQPSVDI